MKSNALESAGMIMYRKVVKLSLFLFPLLLTVSSLISILESYKYVGFVGKHLFLSSFAFYFLASIDFVIVITSKILLRKIQNSKIHKYFYRITSILSIIFLLIIIFLSELDVINYKNYSFSKFHFQTQNLIYTLSLLLLGTIIFFMTDKKYISLRLAFFRNIKNEIHSIYGRINFQNLRKSFTIPGIYDNNHLPKNILLTFSILLLICFGAFNFISGGKRLLDDDVYIISHFNFTYDQKMEVQWGLLYRLVELIQRNTPDGSTVLFPPWVSPWSVDGNINQVKIFMGKRILLNAENIYKLNENPDYIIIARGGLHSIYDVVRSKDEYGWPKFFVPATTIWYIDNDAGTVITVHKDFDPKDPINSKVWGLIEVDKTRLSGEK